MAHMFKKQNRVAGAMAKEGIRNAVLDVPIILQVSPMCAQQVLEANILGITFTRTTINEDNFSQGLDAAQTIINRNFSMRDTTK